MLLSFPRDFSTAPTLLVISPRRSGENKGKKNISTYQESPFISISKRWLPRGESTRPESETQALKTSFFSSSIYKTASPPWPILSSTTLSPPSTSADAPLSPYCSRATSTNPLRLTPPCSASGGTSCSFSFMGCIRLLPKEVVNDCSC